MPHVLTRPTRRLGVVAVAGVLTVLAAPAPLVAGTPSQIATTGNTGNILPLEDFSPASSGSSGS